MKTVLVVFGTRPEAIKMAPVVKSLADAVSLKVRVCVTAQHREMLDQVLEFFGITPDFDLNIMRPNQDLSSLTAEVLGKVSWVCGQAKPDLVLAHGDTTTCFAASLAAFYCGVDVGHVEAGLRTGSLRSPWPEEANRKLTAVLGRHHFAPTETARANLLREGISPESIHLTGNTVVDALLQTVGRLEVDAALKQQMSDRFPFLRSGSRLVLITGHRRENFGAGLRSICTAIKRLAADFPETDFVYPVHLNPMVVHPVRTALGGRANIHLIEPQDYLPFVWLMKRSSIILSDSGGVQEEAPSLGKPVLVMRDATERPEAVQAGTAELVGTDGERIHSAASRLLRDAGAYDRMCSSKNPYGDGRAATRIAGIVADILSKH
jgi:UDP-N-acetylglucosamine 2-epimerase (non-hydrolysing)